MLKSKTGIEGFTLVEVLVALAVFSGLMLTLFSSFNAFTASSRMIKEYESRSRNTGPGLATLASDLEQIFVLQPPQFMDPEAEGAEFQIKFKFSADIDSVDGHAFSRLEFAALSPVQFRSIPDRTAGITRLSYYVSAHGERMDLHRADTPVCFPDRENSDPCRDPVLFRDVRQFELTFFDARGNEYDQWDSRDEKVDYGLPVRVGITIVLGGPAGPTRISTQVGIPVSRSVKE